MSLSGLSTRRCSWATAATQSCSARPARTARPWSTESSRSIGIAGVASTYFSEVVLSLWVVVNALRAI
jgi:hypothetical protein